MNTLYLTAMQSQKGSTLDASQIYNKSENHDSPLSQERPR